MSAIDMSATMDALAARLIAGDVTKRVYPYPAESVNAPCAVVGYPTDLDFDVTFQRGSDRAVFPVYVLVGKAMSKASRDALSDLIAGATGVKDAIDGNLGGVVQSARVTDMTVEEVTVSAVAYIGARFSVEVYT